MILYFFFIYIYLFILFIYKPHYTGTQTHTQNDSNIISDVLFIHKASQFVPSHRYHQSIGFWEILAWREKKETNKNKTQTHAHLRSHQCLPFPLLLYFLVNHLRFWSYKAGHMHSGKESDFYLTSNKCRQFRSFFQIFYKFFKL